MHWIIIFLYSLYLEHWLSLSLSFATLSFLKIIGKSSYRISGFKIFMNKRITRRVYVNLSFWLSRSLMSPLNLYCLYGISDNSGIDGLQTTLCKLPLWGPQWKLVGGQAVGPSPSKPFSSWIAFLCNFLSIMVYYSKFFPFIIIFSWHNNCTKSISSWIVFLYNVSFNNGL